MIILNKEINEITENSNLNNLSEINYTTIDSYTIDINNKKITAFIILNQERKNPEIIDIVDYFNIIENKYHLENRFKLAKILSVPIYLISFDKDFIFTISMLFLDNKKLMVEQKKMSLNDVDIFFKELRGERNKVKEKKIKHLNSNDTISILMNNGINIGGNLDGFFIDAQEKKIKLIELSKRGVKNIDYNGNQTKNYSPNIFMKEDFQRWYSLNLLKNEIKKRNNCELDIIVWSAHNHYIKFFHNCSFEGENSIKLDFKYEKEIFLDKKISNKIKETKKI